MNFSCLLLVGLVLLQISVEIPEDRLVDFGEVEGLASAIDEVFRAEPNVINVVVDEAWSNTFGLLVFLRAQRVQSEAADREAAEVVVWQAIVFHALDGVLYLLFHNGLLARLNWPVEPLVELILRVNRTGN